MCVDAALCTWGRNAMYCGAHDLGPYFVTVYTCVASVLFGVLKFTARASARAPRPVSPTA